MERTAFGVSVPSCRKRSLADSGVYSPEHFEQLEAVQSRARLRHPVFPSVWPRTPFKRKNATGITPPVSVTPPRQRGLRIFYNAVSVAGLIGCAVVCVYLYSRGIFTDQNRMRAFLSSQSASAPLLFILLQILQVVFPIIPGGISLAAGVWIFGPWFGFLYNYIGICIGSVLNFLIARRFGKPLVEAVVSPRIYRKYIGWLDKGKRFDTLFAWAIFLPVAPDDYLCMLAGLTSISLKKYVAIILLCKPASIFLYSIGLSSLISFLISRISG